MNFFSELSIFMTGNWNVKIFTPLWIMKELLSLSSEEKVEVRFDNVNLVLYFKYKDCLLIPTDRYFEIKTTDFSSQNISFVNKTTLKLLELLPHTPKVVAGINLKATRKGLLENFKIKLPQKDLSFEEIRLERKLVDNILNIVYIKGKEEDLVTLNFHYSDIKSLKPTSIQENIQIANEYYQDYIRGKGK